MSDELEIGVWYYRAWHWDYMKVSNGVYIKRMNSFKYIIVNKLFDTGFTVEYELFETFDGSSFEVASITQIKELQKRLDIV